MARRNRPHALQPRQQPTWLVVRNMHRAPLEWREIAPGVNLRTVLEAARSERAAAGWACTEPGRVMSSFFADRSGERLQIGVEAYDPGGPGAPGHSDARRSPR